MQQSEKNWHLVNCSLELEYGISSSALSICVDFLGELLKVLETKMYLGSIRHKSSLLNPLQSHQKRNKCGIHGQVIARIKRRLLIKMFVSWSMPGLLGLRLGGGCRHIFSSSSYLYYKPSPSWNLLFFGSKLDGLLLKQSTDLICFLPSKQDLEHLSVHDPKLFANYSE